MPGRDQLVSSNELAHPVNSRSTQQGGSGGCGMGSNQGPAERQRPELEPLSVIFESESLVKWVQLERAHQWCSPPEDPSPPLLTGL